MQLTAWHITRLAGSDWDCGRKHNDDDLIAISDFLTFSVHNLTLSIFCSQRTWIAIMANDTTKLDSFKTDLHKTVSHCIKTLNLIGIIKL